MHYRASKRETQSVVYDELQKKFRLYVDVLSEISERTSSSPLSVIQLYERWLATGSEWMERRLRAHGLLSKGDS